MKFKQIVLVLFLFHMVLIIRTPAFVDMETSFMRDSSNEIDNLKYNLEKPNEMGMNDESIGNKESIESSPNKAPILEDSEETLQEVLDTFNPNISLTGDYSGEEVQGIYERDNSSIVLPGNGEFFIEGNITDLESQYMQNPGAEEDQQFYSNNPITTGLELERVEESRSLEGEYIWEFYSHNTESITYALYQEDIDLYNTDIEISYNYLLLSNSTLQNVINSSLIFDFVFDTCRIMVIHWHYTDVEPPSIGENTTSPFIVYRLLQNSSWNDQWNNYSLSVSDLFTEGDPFIPTMIKSFGVYVISPEESECTVYIDAFEIRTPLEPQDVDLEVCGIPITSTGIGTGDFRGMIQFNGGSPYNYNISWSHNSIFTLNTNFTIKVSGEVDIPYRIDIILHNETIILLSIFIEGLSMLIDSVNITYPEYWMLYGAIQGANIESNNNLGNGYNLLSLSRIIDIYDIELVFSLPNYITNITYENISVFEEINASIDLLDFASKAEVNVLWSAENNGSSICELMTNQLSFIFPSWLSSGNIDLMLIIIKGDLIGFSIVSIDLQRKPAEMIVANQVTIPEYALQEIKVVYFSLDIGIDIENAIVTAQLDGETIPSSFQNGKNIFSISSFYLTQNSYVLIISAQSQTHASITKQVNITISDSDILIDLNYENTGSPTDFLLEFNVTSDGLPVAFAPVIIEIDETNEHTGVTDKNGNYLYGVSLPLDSLSVNISCSVFRIYNIVSSRFFEISFENVQASVKRSTENAIVSSNITLTFEIQYPIYHDRWILLVEDEMVPVLDAYIETQTLRIPVYWDENTLYWQTQADNETTNHKLILTTIGPEIATTLEEVDKDIQIHFVISSDVKSYSNISIIYYFNDSYETSKYIWKLLANNQNDVTSYYNLDVNDLYVFITNLDLAKGSLLILDLVGTKVSNSKSITNVIIPLVSGSAVLFGAVATILKIYNKKKGMILEI